MEVKECVMIHNCVNKSVTWHFIGQPVILAKVRGILNSGDGLKWVGFVFYFLNCPFLNTTNLYGVSSSSPMGPRAWSLLSVLMLISTYMASTYIFFVNQ